jgi:hypothetical protein
MSGDEELLARLERQVRYLNDRQEILDCVARHARGHDRFDPICSRPPTTRTVPTSTVPRSTPVPRTHSGPT